MVAENACSALVKTAWSPEMIEGVPVAHSDDDVPRVDTVQFRPSCVIG
jgi:hypothetical protein